MEHQSHVTAQRIRPFGPATGSRGQVTCHHPQYLMATSKKRSGPKLNFDTPLSPEADKFLAEATAEFNAKQEALRRDWRFEKAAQWAYDQVSGILKLDFNDGAQFQADGQILGSYSAGGGSWEWAWNNPHVEAAMAKDSKLVKQIGERLGIAYLIAPMIPVPAEDFAAYLAAIGVKATGAIGVYRGKAGPIDVFITLKRPRWAKKTA